MMDEQTARMILDPVVWDKGLTGTFHNPDDWNGWMTWPVDFPPSLCPMARLEGEFTADQLEAIAWWMRNKGGEMNIKQMIDEIREIIGQCDRNVPEIDMYAALVNESEGWRMRLEELEADEDYGHE